MLDGWRECERTWGFLMPVTEKNQRKPVNLQGTAKKVLSASQSVGRQLGSEKEKDFNAGTLRSE